MSDVQSAVRAFIVNEFLQGEDSPDLRSDTNLRESGVMDSLGTIALVSFVEETHGFEVAATDATEDNFGTIAAVVAYIGRHREGTDA